MKKVTILSLHLGFGGIEKSVVALANILCENYEVEIVSTYRLYDKPSFNVDSRVHIVYLMEGFKPNKEEIKAAIKSKNVFSFAEECFKATKILSLRKKTMVNYIKNCDSDVIIATRDIFDKWLSQYGKKDTLKIGWEHNHYHNNMKYAKKIVNSNKGLDYLVLVSNGLKDFYAKKMSKFNCQCVYIPNIIDNMPKEGSLLSKKKLISVGRLSPEKGYMDLLKIFSILHKKYPDWTLDIVGDGNEKEKMDEYIKNNNLSKFVTLHGYQMKDYIDKLLNNSSIYLMTSYTESFGIVLIEAMSHGVPPIAFDSAEGANELIVDGENGYLIKNRNFDEYVEKVEYLINDKQERKKMGIAGMQCAKMYTSDVVCKQWFDLIGKK